MWKQKKNLVSKSQQKRQHQRPRDRQEDDIKMDFMEISCEAVNWIEVAQDRVQ
jgi:hypothetical protein